MLELNLHSANITIEVDEFELSSTIHIKGEGLDFEIHIDQSNLDYLRQKLLPQGLIPDDFPMKIIMMNQIIEDIGDVIDANDTGFELDKVYYNRDEDKTKRLAADTVYFETREVE